MSSVYVMRVEGSRQTAGYPGAFKVGFSSRPLNRASKLERVHGGTYRVIGEVLFPSYVNVPMVEMVMHKVLRDAGFHPGQDESHQLGAEYFYGTSPWVALELIRQVAQLLCAGVE